MGQAEFSGWNGYSIRMDEDMVSHDIYRTEEYTVGWHEGMEREYLWYQKACMGDRMGGMP